MRLIKQLLLITAIVSLCSTVLSQKNNDSIKLSADKSQQIQIKKTNHSQVRNLDDTIPVEKHQTSGKERWTNILIVTIIIVIGILIAGYVRSLEKSSLVKKIENQKIKVDELNIVLNETNKQLSELVATRDRFMSLIAHDLKSPFNSIIGFSEIIAEEARDLSTDEIIEYANSIRDSSKNTLMLLQNLLDWSRAQTGSMMIEKGLFSLKDTIEENFRLHRLAAEKKRLELVNNVGKETVVFADESMISAVVRNLVGNAIKFTASGSVVVDAKKTSGLVEVSITDTGMGISPENVKKLFRENSFYTTRGTENERGTGLGLRLCKEFVEQNDGTIKVESVVGKGSRFIFTIPTNSEL